MSAGPRTPFENPVIEWVDSRLPIFTMLTKEYGVFPTPKNFNYFWNFGAIAMVMLVTMIITGITLSMHYVANSHLAFDSVERIMRDVNYGWLIRYIHMNGASFFFIAVYVHIFRGMYYGSYKKPRELLWMLGVLIFLLMMATAFMGYVLPWGQMSFWGATVITNLFSAIPVIGKVIVQWMWGGFSVDNPTLNRFFSLHFLLPFVICAVVGLHVWALHVTGSNNPTGIDVKSNQDTVPFNPYYTVKDSFGILIFLIAFVLATFFFPNYLGHTDNYIPANPLVTPAHIVPEWYFLPFYAMLRAINFDINPVMIVGLLGVVYYGFEVFYKKSDYFKPMNLAALAVGGLLALVGLVGSLYPELHIPLTDIKIIEAKLGGVLAMFGSIAILFVFPFLDTHPVRSAVYRPIFRATLIVLVAVVFGLGKLGGMMPDVPLLGPITTTHISQLLTLYYFAFFLVIIPWLNKHEIAKPMPASIHEAVLAKNKGAA